MKANGCEQLRTQSQLPLLSSLPEPKPAPSALLAKITSEEQAIVVAMRLKPGGPYFDAFFAQSLGISRSYFSEIKRGDKPMPRKLRARFAAVTGSTLLTQFEQLQSAMRTVSGRATERDRVEQILRDAGVANAA